MRAAELLAAAHRSLADRIAATLDVVCGGRLDFGIGAGSRPSLPMARLEYEAYGLPYHDFAHSVGDLAEACTVIRRLWTSEQPRASRTSS